MAAVRAPLSQFCRGRRCLSLTKDIDKSQDFVFWVGSVLLVPEKVLHKAELLFERGQRRQFLVKLVYRLVPCIQPRHCFLAETVDASDYLVRYLANGQLPLLVILLQKFFKSEFELQELRFGNLSPETVAECSVHLPNPEQRVLVVFGLDKLDVFCDRDIVEAVTDRLQLWLLDFIVLNNKKDIPDVGTEQSLSLLLVTVVQYAGIEVCVCLPLNQVFQQEYLTFLARRATITQSSS